MQALPTLGWHLQCAEAVLSLVQHAPPDLRWNIGLDEFEEILASKSESAPRPDGLPKTLYRSAGGIGPDFSSLLTRLACRERLSL